LEKRKEPKKIEEEREVLQLMKVACMVLDFKNSYRLIGCQILKISHRFGPNSMRHADRVPNIEISPSTSQYMVHNRVDHG
jgi:hypothetical protein